MMKQIIPTAKKIRWRAGVIGLLLLFVLAGTAVYAAAQSESRQWEGPVLLSNPGVVETGEAKMVPDPYGNLHVFWSEVNPADRVHSIQYTVFDGESWAKPVDIFFAPRGFEIVSYAAAVDDQGQLYLVWNQGNVGPLLFASAPIDTAMSAQAWSEPQTIDAPAHKVHFEIDSQGTFHIMYENFYGQEPGIYYMRTERDSSSLSVPFWLDPDVPQGFAPTLLKFVIDDQDGLHATWYYRSTEPGNLIVADWVRYAHSLDGGRDWSIPITIDRVEGDDAVDELRLPHPGLAVTGSQVHIVWAGNENTEREHRYSLDRGLTWTNTERILGNLHGQGLGGGLVIDAIGRIHYFAQIRWPQGVYHMIWDGEQWLDPSMIYFIARGGTEDREGRYHAHSVRAGIRAGNQLVVTFTDEATGPTYAMWATLDDVASVETAAPQPTPTAVSEVAAVPLAVNPTPTTIPLDAASQAAPFDSPNTASGLWLGLVPAGLLLLGIVFFFGFWSRQRA